MSEKKLLKILLNNGSELTNAILVCERGCIVIKYNNNRESKIHLSTIQDIKTRYIAMEYYVKHVESETDLYEKQFRDELEFMLS